METHTQTNRPMCPNHLCQKQTEMIRIYERNAGIFLGSIQRKERYKTEKRERQSHHMMSSWNSRVTGKARH